MLLSPAPPPPPAPPRPSHKRSLPQDPARSPARSSHVSAHYVTKAGRRHYQLSPRGGCRPRTRTRTPTPTATTTTTRRRHHRGVVQGHGDDASLVPSVRPHNVPGVHLPQAGGPV
jgi:hypothetical protein